MVRLRRATVPQTGSESHQPCLTPAPTTVGAFFTPKPPETSKPLDFYDKICYNGSMGVNAHYKVRIIIYREGTIYEKPEKLLPQPRLLPGDDQ